MIISANLLHNPLGEGVHEIIKVFEQKEQLRTLCGFEEGIKEIDWKDSGKGPTEILLLAADLRACRAIAAIASLSVAGAFTPAMDYLVTLFKHTHTHLIRPLYSF